MKDITLLEEFKKIYPEKFMPEAGIFGHIHAGDRIFIGTGCGEPQYLVQALVNYVKNDPKAFFDAELIHVWTLGVAPYTDETPMRPGRGSHVTDGKPHIVIRSR
jgi:acyl-CoA hydrolase